MIDANDIDIVMNIAKQDKVSVWIKGLKTQKKPCVLSKEFFFLIFNTSISCATNSSYLHLSK